MRTTVNIDEDVLFAVQERARREKRSAGKVLSDLAREALTSGARDHSDDDGEGHHGFVPFPHRGPPVTNELINRLREDGPY